MYVIYMVFLPYVSKFSFLVFKTYFLAVGTFLSKKNSCGTPPLLICNTCEELWMNQSKRLDVLSFPYVMTTAAPEALALNLGPQKTRFEINAPNHLTSYITASIYIRNHLQWQLFSGSSSHSPRGAEFSICSAG